MRTPRPVSVTGRPLPDGQLLVLCPICDWCHPQGFNGDCREDDARFYTPDHDEWETQFFDVADPRNPESPFYCPQDEDDQ